jgi:hypothetical protein
MRVEGSDSKEAIMQAHVHDRISVPGHKVGELERECEVLEVRGDDGRPPYRVRWGDGHESIYYPGSDATVSHPS